MNDAEGFVHVASFAKGKAGIAGLFRQINALAQSGLRVENDQPLAGPHDVAHNAAAQVQGVKNDLVAQARGGRLALVEHQAQFLF